MGNTTYNEAAESCARQLAKMFGSEEAAAKAIMEDPESMVAIAMDAHMAIMRKMALKAHMNPRSFASQVLSVVR